MYQVKTVKMMVFIKHLKTWDIDLSVIWAIDCISIAHTTDKSILKVLRFFESSVLDSTVRLFMGLKLDTY